MAAAAGNHVLLTDAGSVKGTICNQVEADPVASKLFVGAHPIAGSDKGGFEFSEADLFVNRPCIVTDSQADELRVQRTVDFWEHLGCQVTRMSPDEHDRILAVTSHLPHILAAVTASCVQESDLPYTGTGFRDTTRIAAGSAELWKHILAGNRQQVMKAIAKAESLLESIREALIESDDEQVKRLLQSGADNRSRINDD